MKINDGRYSNDEKGHWVPEMHVIAWFAEDEGGVIAITGPYGDVSKAKMDVMADAVEAFDSGDLDGWFEELTGSEWSQSEFGWRYYTSGGFLMAQITDVNPA